MLQILPIVSITGIQWNLNYFFKKKLHLRLYILCYDNINLSLKKENVRNTNSWFAVPRMTIRLPYLPTNLFCHITE